MREALQRLQRGVPIFVPVGTPVSQCAVAREAGLTPSALRKSRFPELVAEIKAAKSEGQKSGAAQSGRDQLRLLQSVKVKNAALREERDRALSLLVLADAEIMRLTLEVSRITARLEEIQSTPVRLRGTRAGARIGVVAGAD